MLKKTEIMRVVDLHKRLVEIPSLSREEAPIADFIESYILDITDGSRGLVVTREGDNVCIQLGAGSDILLLNTHLDVVPPSTDHPWDPFTAVESEGLIYGRGSVDAKASVAAMLTALLTLFSDEYEPTNGRIILALTVCEELGGTSNGLEQILPLLPEPSAAVVGEPTMMHPCVAQKGLLILKMVARGKTAHAARAHLGTNAIEISARDISKVSAIQFERIHPELGATTLTATMVQGGSARNIVPDECTVFLDIRSTPSYTHDELITIIQGAVESDILVHSDRLISVDTSVTEPIVQAALRAYSGSAPFGSPTLSDWIFLKGTPTIKMGPGDSNMSHTANEHVAISQLELGVTVYRETIKAYFEPQLH